LSLLSGQSFGISTTGFSRMAFVSVVFYFQYLSLVFPSLFVLQFGSPIHNYTITNSIGVGISESCFQFSPQTRAKRSYQAIGGNTWPKTHKGPQDIDMVDQNTRQLSKYD